LPNCQVDGIATDYGSFLFVHGLGGHPFKSWTSGIESPIDLKMWPRDLLPQSLLEKGYSGRYSTVGYKAPGLRGRASTSATINRAAEDLLAVLWNGTQLVNNIFILSSSLAITFIAGNRSATRNRWNKSFYLYRLLTVPISVTTDQCILHVTASEV